MSAKSISVRDLLAERARGEVRIVIDVRSAEEFADCHVEGAVHVPGAHVTRAVSHFDPRARFITVCTKGGGRSRDAAEALIEIGRDAVFLRGGTLAWISEVMPS